METRTTLCQCTRCASVFEWNERMIDRDSKEGEIELFANEGIRITMVLKNI